ncbi:MAG: DUF4097 domain-containing protein [Oscillospiraceae bacterium]|nr:DUF4097 domain-containing protein [Oscillospiraceae bacterium]
MIKKCLKLAGFGIMLVIIGLVLIALSFGFGYSGDGLFGYNQNYSNWYNSANWTDYVEMTTAGNDDFSFYDADYVFHEINIDCSMGSFHIIGGENFSIETRGISGEYFDHSFEGGILNVTYNPSLFSSLNTLNPFSSYSNYGEVHITVPNDEIIEKANIKIGAGELNVVDLDTAQLSIIMSAGQAALSDVNAEESAEIIMSAGTLAYYNSTLNNLYCRISAGQLAFSECEIDNGSFRASAGELTAYNTPITGSNSIDMSAGYISMSFPGNILDYDFIISKTAGSVIINGDDSVDRIVPVYDNNQFGITINGDDSVDRIVRNPEAAHSFNIKATAGVCDINIW